MSAESGTGTKLPPISRRKFLKAAAVLTSAAASACGRSRPGIYTYVKDPGYTPGKSVWYASACRECAAGCGVIVKTRDGRPYKIDGNPEHPVNRGALCARGQASIYREYSEERIRQPLVAGERSTWEAALGRIEEKLSGGGRVAVLTGVEENIAVEAVRLFARKFNAEHYVFEPNGFAAERSAYRQLHGRDEIPRYDLDDVDCMVSFGADLFDGYVSPMETSRAYANLRDRNGCLIYVGSRVNLTSDSADRFVPVDAGREQFVAAAVLREVALAKQSPYASYGMDVAEAAAKSGVAESEIRAIVEKLVSAKSAFAFCGDAAFGSSATATYAMMINQALGASSLYRGNHALSRADSPERIAELARAVRDGRISVLICRGVDPFAYPALFPPDAAQKIGLLVAVEDQPNVTTGLAQIVLADQTPFESWGVYESASGIETLQQPTIRPADDARAFAVVMAALAGVELDPLERIRASWSEDEMKRGFRTGEIAPAPGATNGIPTPSPTPIEAGGAVVVAYPSVLLGDTRHEYNKYLQEIPDPINQTFWQTPVEIHKEFAAARGIKEGDVVELKTAGGSLRMQARLHERGGANVVAIGIGRTGRKRRREYSENPLDLFTEEDFARGVRFRAVEVSRISAGQLPLAAGSQEQGDRNIAREMREDGAGAAHHVIDPTIRLYNESKHPERRWGMTVDLDKCTGCSACVAACYIENNIPVVGPALMGYGRELSWLTIQRYRTDHGMVSMPVMCQQCTQAPCEPVCPVYATYHSPEGLNVQVYNRCIGTRYCSNNCPYKVRRFNWFNFSTSVPNGMMNPDVSVRTVGVMEKCTFCVQRIREVEHASKREQRPIRDGEIKTACQQTCPTQAIIFGNLKDESAAVVVARAKADAEGRGYGLLEELGTGPAVRYLEKKRNV